MEVSISSSAVSDGRIAKQEKSALDGMRRIALLVRGAVDLLEACYPAMARATSLRKPSPVTL